VHAGEHEAAREIIKKYTAGYVAVSDYPNTVFVPDLLELYPEAKVVLVQRDPVNWWKSVEHVARHVTTPVLPILTWTTPGLRNYPAHVRMWFHHGELQLAKVGKPLGPGKSESFRFHL
jgi:hypothetical protein